MNNKSDNDLITLRIGVIGSEHYEKETKIRKEWIDIFEREKEMAEKALQKLNSSPIKDKFNAEFTKASIKNIENAVYRINMIKEISKDE